MTADRVRALAALEYGDPRRYLISLAKLQPIIAASGQDRSVRTLRTNELKIHRERRQAALFCCFMADRMNTEVLFTRVEAQDYDFVARWEIGGAGVRYAPTQLKEVVPAYLNPQASVEAVIASLSKYADSSDLSIAIHLNKDCDFNPRSLRIPTLSLASLWIFWATGSDGKRWALLGDLLREPSRSLHEYPTA